MYHRELSQEEIELVIKIQKLKAEYCKIGWGWLDTNQVSNLNQLYTDLGYMITRTENDEDDE